MAVITGERRAIPSANPTRPRQAPVPGGNPWHIPGVGGLTIGTNAPPAPPQPAPVSTPAPAAPAAPPDYWALAGVDPQFTMGQGLEERRNTMNLQTLQDAWKRHGQQSQDAWNAHGALFSGGAIHAQQFNDQQYANQQAQQALSHDQNLNDLRWGVFNRLVQQAAIPIGA